MPPLANVRIRAAIKLGLPISEIDHLLDNLGAQRIAIVHEIHGGYLAWGTTRYIALEQKLKDDDTYAVVVSSGFGHNALICKTADQADKVARQIVTGTNVTESAESRVVGTVDLGGEQVHNLYKLVSSEGFKPVPTVLTHGRGFTLFDDNGGTGDVTHHNLYDYLAQHGQFALVINNGWFYIAAIGDDRKALEKFARKLAKDASIKESTGRVVGRVLFDGSIHDADDISAKYGAVGTSQYCYTNLLGSEFHATSQRPLADLLDCTDRYAVVVTFRDTPFAYMFADRGSAGKFARAVSKAGVTEALKSDVTDLGTVETDETTTANKGGLRNYLRGKFNVLGINREVYSNYHYNYGVSAHDGEYYLPNSDASGPLTSLADRLVTQRVFEPGTKSSDLAIVRFIHHEAIYSTDVRYVIGFKSAIEKLIRSVRSDAVKLEALPDPGKL